MKIFIFYIRFIIFITIFEVFFKHDLQLQFRLSTTTCRNFVTRLFENRVGSENNKYKKKLLPYWFNLTTVTFHAK